MGFSSFNNSDVRCGPIPYTGMLYYNRILEFNSATSIKYMLFGLDDHPSK